METLSGVFIAVIFTFIGVCFWILFDILGKVGDRLDKQSKLLISQSEYIQHLKEALVNVAKTQTEVTKDVREDIKRVFRIDLDE